MTIYYYVPNMNTPSGGMAVLMKQVRILKDANYDVKFIYEKQDKSQPDFNPTWMEFSVADIPKILINNITSFGIKKEDVLVIPEGFGELIKLTKNVSYKRVVLAQSWIYIFNSMRTPESWKDNNIEHVISVSEAITDYLKIFMPNMKIHTYKQSINHDIFKPSNNKTPRICFSANRGQENQMKTFNVIKTFQAICPKYKNIPFLELKGMSRETFAKNIAESTFVLYTDEIAGFGTLPLEAMACNTHVIGWKSIGGKEYMSDNNGFWVENGNCMELALMLKKVVENYFDGYLNEEELFFNYKETSDLYNEKDEKTLTLSIFENILK